MSGSEALVQNTIEHLLAKTQSSGMTMRLLNSASAYMGAADDIICWIDPACAQQRGGFESQMFWIEFIDQHRRRAVLAAGMSWQTDDIIQDISLGHLWYPGGYAEHCALHHIDLAEPSRLISGRLSYLQFGINKDAEPSSETIEDLALLVQALGFRHHHSDFSIHLGVHSPSVLGMPMLPKSFRSNDFLATTYFPPANEGATLTLSHSSLDDFIEIAPPSKASTTVEAPSADKVSA